MVFYINLIFVRVFPQIGFVIFQLFEILGGFVQRVKMTARGKNFGKSEIGPDQHKTSSERLQTCFKCQISYIMFWKLLVQKLPDNPTV